MMIYRTDKGAPLTIEEMDDNFRELEDRLKALETHLDSGEGIGKITAHGDALTITGTFGTDFGTFPLPKATLTPRGPWASETPYHSLDFVMYNQGVYCCLKDHLSTLWEHDAPLWQEILTLPKPLPLPLYEKATLPSQDDLGKLALLIEETGITPLFFDGKGWQRLTKGADL